MENIGNEKNLYVVHVVSLKRPKIIWGDMLRSNWKLEDFLQTEGNLKISKSLKEIFKFSIWS